jgi:hypothetical protein
MELIKLLIELLDDDDRHRSREHFTPKINEINQKKLNSQKCQFDLCDSM